MKMFHGILFFSLLLLDSSHLIGGYEKIQEEEISSIKNSSLEKESLLKSDLESEISCHHLPKDNQEYKNLMIKHWKGVELYNEKKYSESIEYFLFAEQYYLPSCLEYLFDFINRKEHYFEKGVSQKQIDLIVSRLPKETSFQALYARYKVIFTESQITPDEVYQKNQKSRSITTGSDNSYNKPKLFYESFTENLTSIFSNFSSFLSKNKEE